MDAHIAWARARWEAYGGTGRLKFVQSDHVLSLWWKDVVLDREEVPIVIGRKPDDVVRTTIDEELRDRIRRQRWRQEILDHGNMIGSQPNWHYGADAIVAACVDRAMAAGRRGPVVKGMGFREGFIVTHQPYEIAGSVPVSYTSVTSRMTIDVEMPDTVITGLADTPFDAVVEHPLLNGLGIVILEAFSIPDGIELEVDVPCRRIAPPTDGVEPDPTIAWIPEPLPIG